MRTLWRYARWVLLCLALVVSGWLAWTAKLRSEFEEQLEALREAGEPVELSELMPAAIPDAQNAAPLLERAAEMIGDVPLALDDDPEFDFEEEEQAAAREWLAQQGDAVALLHEAAARPGCVFGIDWTRGYEAEIRPIAWTQEFARTLQAYARREAAAGRPREALRCVVTLFRIGDHMPRPAIMGYLVRITAHGIAMATLVDLARGPGFDVAEAAAALEPRLREAERLEPLLFSLRAERVMLLSLVQRWIAGESPRPIMERLTGPDEEPVPVPVSDWLWSSWLTRPFAYRDGLFLIGDVGRGVGRIEARAFDELARSKPPRRGMPYLFSNAFATLPQRLGSLRREFEARIAVARGGLAALLARRRGGAFPTDLALPTDPFTGQPLRYQVRADGTARIEAARPVPDGDPFDEEIVWELTPPVTR